MTIPVLGLHFSTRSGIDSSPRVPFPVHPKRQTSTSADYSLLVWQSVPESERPGERDFLGVKKPLSSRSTSATRLSGCSFFAETNLPLPLSIRRAERGCQSP